MLLVGLEHLCGNKEDAIKLSKTMKEIGKLAGKETVCILTNMDEPLGVSVGNNLEVIEAIRALKGDMEEDVKDVVLELGSYMIKLAGFGEDILENKINANLLGAVMTMVPNTNGYQYYAYAEEEPTKKKRFGK